MVCAALVVLSACGGDNPSSPDSTAFDLSALIQRLRDQGATVESIRSIAQPFFSVAGQVLRVNGEEVQAFEYATETDARAEAASVSPNGFTIGTTMVSWVATPHFYLMGSVIAIYVGDNQAVLGPLQAVMGAQFAGG